MIDEVQLKIEVLEDTDPEALDRAARTLRRDLVEIDDVTAKPAATDATTPGAKGDIGLLGTISVTMISTAIPAVIALINRWVQERQDRGRCVVKISKPDGTSLELTHTLSRDEIERIVQSLVPR